MKKDFNQNLKPLKFKLNNGPKYLPKDFFLPYQFLKVFVYASMLFYSF